MMKEPRLWPLTANGHRQSLEGDLGMERFAHDLAGEHIDDRREEVPVCRSKAPKIRHGGPDLRRDAAAGGEEPTFPGSYVGQIGEPLDRQTKAQLSARGGFGPARSP